MQSSLYHLVSEETQKKCNPNIINFAKHIVRKCRNPPMAVIFYGSQTKHLEPEGLIDFYLILNKVEDFSQKKIGLLANKILPPNIYFFKYNGYRAKVAIMSFSQLQKRTRLKHLDTTIWARFSQPIYLVWIRDQATRYLLNKEVCSAIYTASLWSALLGSKKGNVEDYLKVLYQNTFKTEIRVENQERIAELIKRNIERYSQYFVLSWKDLGIPFYTQEKIFTLSIKNETRQLFQKRWKRIKIWGKIQNILRLLKAAITFNGGADYLRWKVRRHTGKVIRLSSYERKYPAIELPITVLKIIFSLIFKKKI